MLPIFVSGFFLGLSLILVVGAQNAFVLRQGLKNQFVFVVCLLCAVSDALLIGFGVSGFDALLQQWPEINWFARYGGATFLLVYAGLSFQSAFSKHHALVSDKETKDSLLKVVFVCLALTWLNPHVYLDTVMLLGSLSTQYHPHQWTFALGAMSASLLFFFALGYGAKYLAPMFKNLNAWKVLDFLVGVMMASIAISLLWSP